MIKIIALFHIFYKAKNKTVNKFSYSTYLIQNKNFNFTLLKVYEALAFSYSLRM